MTTRQPDPAPGAEPERGFVLAAPAKGADAKAELAELRELARTAGVEPIGELVQHRERPDPRTYVGKGKLDELQEAFKRSAAESLIVDDELTPVQQRRLEDALQARVVDRTQLILDIFAQHAVSAEGKLQVELAQLEYNLPRMRGLWQHLERLGGGLGTRGPGESQLETDRRLARRRVTLLRERLRRLAKQRATRRKSRRRSETPTIALAGYTNVGKSTLLNALTDAGVSVDDRLFETLDPTTRGFEVDGRRYLVTDTVGFIRRLPHQLVEGFAATLEETLVADLVLHVVDASTTDDELDAQLAAVRGGARRDRCGRAPGRARAQQDRRRRPAAAAARSATASPRRCRSRHGRARGSTRSASGSPSGSASASSLSGCSSRTTRAARLAELYALGMRRSTSATTARRASSSARACRCARCGGSRST